MSNSVDLLAGHAGKSARAANFSRGHGLLRWHPSRKAVPFWELIFQNLCKNSTTIIAEVRRVSPSESPASLSARCRDYIEWGTLIFLSCQLAEMDELFWPRYGCSILSRQQQIRLVVTKGTSWLNLLLPDTITPTMHRGECGGCLLRRGRYARRQLQTFLQSAEVSSIA